MASLLAAMPRLSYRKDAMPSLANDSANCLYVSVFNPNVLFPSLSVGPEPAMMRTTGQVVSLLGRVKVP